MKKRWFVFFIVSLCIFTADISTKYIIEKKLPYLSEVKITDFFNIVHIRNRGVVFGMLSDVQNEKIRLVLNFISVFVMVALLYFARFFSGIPFYTIGAMFGAALGNVSERIFKGYVVDFLDFHIGKYHWPAFNIADSAITVGMIILVSYRLFSKKHEQA